MLGFVTKREREAYKKEERTARKRLVKTGDIESIQKEPSDDYDYDKVSYHFEQEQERKRAEEERVRKFNRKQKDEYGINGKLIIP